MSDTPIKNAGRRRDDPQNRPELLAILSTLAAHNAYMSIREIAQGVSAPEITVRQRLIRLESLSAITGERQAAMIYSAGSALGREVVAMQYQITQYGRDILAGGASAGQFTTPAVNSVFQLGASLKRRMDD